MIYIKWSNNTKQRSVTPGRTEKEILDLRRGESQTRTETSNTIKEKHQKKGKIARMERNRDRLLKKGKKDSRKKRDRMQRREDKTSSKNWKIAGNKKKEQREDGKKDKIDTVVFTIPLYSKILFSVYASSGLLSNGGSNQTNVMVVKPDRINRSVKWMN